MKLSSPVEALLPSEPNLEKFESAWPGRSFLSRAVHCARSFEDIDSGFVLQMLSADAFHSLLNSQAWSASTLGDVVSTTLHSLSSLPAVDGAEGIPPDFSAAAVDLLTSFALVLASERPDTVTPPVSAAANARGQPAAGKSTQRFPHARELDMLRLDLLTRSLTSLPQWTEPDLDSAGTGSWGASAGDLAAALGVRAAEASARGSAAGPNARAADPADAARGDDSALNTAAHFGTLSGVSGGDKATETANTAAGPHASSIQRAGQACAQQQPHASAEHPEEKKQDEKKQSGSVSMLKASFTWFARKVGIVAEPAMPAADSRAVQAPCPSRHLPDLEGGALTDRDDASARGASEDASRSLAADHAADDAAEVGCELVAVCPISLLQLSPYVCPFCSSSWRSLPATL